MVTLDSGCINGCKSRPAEFSTATCWESSRLNIRNALNTGLGTLPCTPHMPGWGLGYLQSLHFMSYIPNAGVHMEFKGHGNVPFDCSTSSLKCENGGIRVPSGPGFGIDIDPDYINKAQPMPS